MWRTKAVTSMMVEQVAELRIPDSSEHHVDRAEALEAAERPEIEALTKARRRAVLVSLVDWIALLVLVVFHNRSGPFLPLGPSTDTVFTLGVLAVATHSGFRLAQARTYSVVARVCRELWDRQGD